MEKLMQDLSSCGYNGESIKSDLTENHQITLEYALFVSKMASEIGSLLETEERVHEPENDEPSSLSSWKMEVSSFLKELYCPLKFLYDGDIQNRLNTTGHRLLLLDFLVSELLSARIEKLDNESPTLESGSVDSSTTAQLSESLKTLNLSSPPVGVAPAQFFKQLLSVIERVNSTQREALLGQPLFTGTLSDEQWKVLQQVAMDLESEYAMRRTMLITRLRATVQSFTWSDRAKNMSESAVEAAEMNEFKTRAFTNTSVADVLAARKDLLTIKKVSSVPPATRGLVKADKYGQLTKVKIGKVPDRGGRPSEQAPPPPEMPSWQQRSGPQHGQQGGGSQGGLHFFGGGQSGSRGGHQQGGGNRGGHNQQGGHQNQDNKGYQGGGGNRGHHGGGGYQQGGHQGGGRSGHQSSSGGGYPGGSGGGYRGGGHQGGGGDGYQDGGYNQGTERGYSNEHDDRGQGGQQYRGNQNKHRGVQGAGWKKR